MIAAGWCSRSADQVHLLIAEVNLPPRFAVGCMQWHHLCEVVTAMLNYSLTLPSDFADYEWEVTAKGYFSEAHIAVSGKQYRLSFYDAVRLSQEIESELESGGVFFEPNLVIVRSVTRIEMERAVEQLVQSGLMALLVPK